MQALNDGDNVDTQMLAVRMGGEFRDKEQGISKWKAALVKHEAVNTQDLRKTAKIVGAGRAS